MPISTSSKIFWRWHPMSKINIQFYEIINFFKQMIPNRKRHIFLAFFAGLSGIFFNLIVAHILKGVYIAVTSKNSMLLYQYISFFIILLAGFFLYNCICWILYGSSSARITGDIRRIMVNKLCSLQLLDIERCHSADIMTIFVIDLNTAQSIYENIRFYLSSLLCGIIPTILVFYYSRVLGLLIIILGFTQLLINLFVINPLEKQSAKIREKLNLINSALSDMLHNNLLIRLYCSEDFYTSVCGDLNKSLYGSKMKLNIIYGVTEGVNICFGLLGYIVVLITGSVLIGDGKLTLPNLLFITQVRLMMIQGILVIGSFMTQLQPAIICIKKILSFMEYTMEEDT